MKIPHNSFDVSLEIPMQSVDFHQKCVKLGVSKIKFQIDERKSYVIHWASQVENKINLQRSFFFRYAMRNLIAFLIIIVYFLVIFALAGW